MGCSARFPGSYLVPSLSPLSSVQLPSRQLLGFSSPKLTMPRQASKGSKVTFTEVKLKVMLPVLERFQKYLKGDPEEEDSLSAVTERCYLRLMSLQESSGESLKLPDEMVQNVSDGILSVLGVMTGS